MTTTEIPHTKKNTDILCRAQGGEPLVRVVVSEHAGAMEVMDPVSGNTGLFPLVDSFQCDAALVERLESAYVSDQSHLRELWSEAQPFAASPESEG